jgi:excisionase family DNA binding protein
MTRSDQHPVQRSPLQLPSLNLVQVITLFVELRDLAQQLIELHRQQIALLRERPAGGATDDLNCISVIKAAEILDFDSRTIHRLLAEGELEAVGSEKRLRILRTSVRAYIERHKKK